VKQVKQVQQVKPIADKEDDTWPRNRIATGHDGGRFAKASKVKTKSGHGTGRSGSNGYGRAKSGRSGHGSEGHASKAAVIKATDDHSRWPYKPDGPSVRQGTPVASFQVLQDIKGKSRSGNSSTSQSHTNTYSGYDARYSAEDFESWTRRPAKEKNNGIGIHGYTFQQAARDRARKKALAAQAMAANARRQSRGTHKHDKEGQSTTRTTRTTTRNYMGSNDSATIDLTMEGQARQEDTQQQQQHQQQQPNEHRKTNKQERHNEEVFTPYDDEDYMFFAQCDAHDDSTAPAWMEDYY
jgi:hypothetical protein